MKTEVYSWRVSTEVKTELEREAQRRKISLAAVLDQAAQEWLKKRSARSNEDEEQMRLQQAALQCLGAFEGSDSRRSEKASQDVRQRLRRRNDR